MTPHEFYLETNGRLFSVNGAYAGECVSLFKYFLKKIGMPDWYKAIGGDGWAYNIYTKANVLGYNKYFDVLPYTGRGQLKDGDWVIWGYGAADCPYSHVALFRKDNGNGTGVFLGQNQGGRRETTQVSIRYSGIIGILRYKNWTNLTLGEKVTNYIPGDFKYENGKFTCQVDAIKIRKAPSLQGEYTGLLYTSGSSVFYDGFVDREGYIWISWISASTGTRRWMAAGESRNGINVRPYGTFK